MAVSTSLKYFHEFSAENWPEGDIVLFQEAFKRQSAKYGALFYESEGSASLVKKGESF